MNESFVDLTQQDLNALKNAFESKQFLHVNSGLGSLSGKFGWNKVSYHLAYGEIENPRLRVAHEEVPLEQLLTVHKKVSTRRQTFSDIVQSRRVQELLKAGGTLIIDKVESIDPVVRSWTNQVARIFGLRVQANFYGSIGHHPGFGLHWDDHDVMVWNFEGRKRWQVWEPTRPFPTYRDIETPSEPVTAPIFDEEIEEGDILFIPRGYWHNVVGVDVPSAHLSLGFEVFNGLEIMRQILDDSLRGKMEFRQDAPFWSSIDDQKNYLESIKTLVCESLDNTSVLDQLLNKHSRTDAHPGVSLPWSAMDVVPDYSNFVFYWQPIYPLNIAVEGDELSFEYSGRRFRFAKSTSDLLKAFEKKGRLFYSDVQLALPPSLETSTVSKFLHSLVVERLVLCEQFCS